MLHSDIEYHDGSLKLVISILVNPTEKITDIDSSLLPTVPVLLTQTICCEMAGGAKTPPATHLSNSRTCW